MLNCKNPTFGIYAIVTGTPCSLTAKWSFYFSPVCLCAFFYSITKAVMKFISQISIRHILGFYRCKLSSLFFSLSMNLTQQSTKSTEQFP